MRRRMTTERPTDWDRYVEPLLFAYREAPQASTRFSPFELLYGRTVRGPMCILREMWSKEGVNEDVFTLYEYVFDLRNRIAETCDLASQNLRSAHKQHFDKKAKMRKLVAVDQILILLPTNHNKLIMKWKGPFEVLQKIGETDYKLQIGNVQKVFHINMLKKYIQREAIETGLAISVIDDSA